MEPSRLELAGLLLDLEYCLRALDLWSATAPSPDALDSVQPFACDRLHFNEWLQFVFIPRVQVILEEDVGMPAACDIAPMAEEYLRAEGIRAEGLLGLLRRIDRLITETD